MVSRNLQRENDRLYDSTHVGPIARSLGIPDDPFGALTSHMSQHLADNWGWASRRPDPSGLGVRVHPRIQAAARSLMAAGSRAMNESATVRKAFARTKNFVGSYAQQVFDGLINKIPGAEYLDRNDRNAIWQWMSTAAQERVYDPLVEWLTTRA